MCCFIVLQMRQPSFISYKASQQSKTRKPVGPRLWCHIFLHERDKDYKLVKVIIGTNGENTKRIHLDTLAKLRIRGKGSGHQETEMGEAPVHLQIAVTSGLNNPGGFARAIKQIIALLNVHVQANFIKYCDQWNLSPDLCYQPLWTYGEMSLDAEELLISNGLLRLEGPNAAATTTDKCKASPMRPGLVDERKKPKQFTKPTATLRSSMYRPGPSCTSIVQPLRTITPAQVVDLPTVTYKPTWWSTTHSMTGGYTMTADLYNAVQQTYEADSYELEPTLMMTPYDLEPSSSSSTQPVPPVHNFPSDDESILSDSAAIRNLEDGVLAYLDETD